ncbi:hypothetical protein [Deinococcus sedimenti]|uniref:hypothetical protein n=1 Tax=Deinococcus sedimenti TaxID=1867090 RepID=UPI00166C6C81|nr:hypothetical protein [Deinococcus sedimenti]
MRRSALACLALLIGAQAGATRVAVAGSVLQGAGVVLEVPVGARGASQFGLSLRSDLWSVSAGSRWFLSPGRAGLYVSSTGYAGWHESATEYGGAVTLGYRWPLARGADLSVEAGGYGAARRRAGLTTGRAGLTATVEIGYRF